MNYSSKLPLALIFATALVGCGGSPGPTAGGELTSAQRAARLELIKSNSSLNDVELAHLCPALYPADVLTNLKHYGFDKQKAKPTNWSPAQLSAAAAARCGTSTPIKAQAKPAKPAPAKPTTPTSTQSATTTSK